MMICWRSLRRTIHNPFVFISIVCICGIFSFFHGFRGGLVSRGNLFENQRELGKPNEKRTYPFENHRGWHNRTVRTRADVNAQMYKVSNGTEYDDFVSSKASWQGNGESEDATKKVGVSCKLGLRRELNSQFQSNTEDVDLGIVEDSIFDNKRTSVVLYVARMRAILDHVMNRLPSSRFINHDGYRRENERGIQIGNYTYYAGGHWVPLDCEPRWKVAIVIPFRNRHKHLSILIRNLIPLLKLQNLEFRIFVSEQDNDMIFNRGMMKNIGYLEALRFGRWDCVVFHDIDQIPMKGANYYGCDGMPRHFCARPEEMGFRPAYELLFGGVVGVTEEQMTKSNGYSNFYWGWGGEDDDLLKRLYSSGYKPTRDLREGFYRSLNHTKKTENEMCDEAYCLLDNYQKRMPWDGVNNITYTASRLKLSLLYTQISVDVRRAKWNSGFSPCSMTETVVDTDESVR
nr:beta-1,4-galactosyltransferase 5-like [Lytechinus pictus]